MRIRITTGHNPPKVEEIDGVASVKTIDKDTIKIEFHEEGKLAQIWQQFPERGEKLKPIDARGI